MILILSKNKGESTTDEVIDWLLTNNIKDFIRINGDDFANKNITIKVNNKNKVHFEYNNQIIDSDKVRLVWFRRTYDEYFLKALPMFGDYENDKNLEEHLKGEMGRIYIFFEYLFSKAKWINKYSQRMNKVKNLHLAQIYGLKTPMTIITNSTTSITNAVKTKKFITKAIGEAVTYFDLKFRYSLFTSRVVPLDFKTSIIFPSKIQEEIEKKYELRLFYCDDTFYTMAIFSQKDKKTQVDFRDYNLTKPNRCVPYLLPKDVENKLRKMILDLFLDTCSIDMLVSKNNEYYFLEINPVGQFGMVSKPCNFFLEKKLAEYVKKNYEKNFI